MANVITNIEDLRVLAQKRVPRMFYDYADSGSWTEGTYRANESDFQKIKLRQRVAVNMEGRSTASQMVGVPVAMPVAIAPTGLTGMQHADGEILAAKAAEKFGRQCVVCAIDAKRREDKSGWDVYLNGGRVNTGIDALEWAKKAEELGAGEILLTSMDCDGTKAGYDIELTRRVSENAKIPVIASGGAGKMEHFLDAFTEGKADAVLAASLFHFREIEINDLKKYLRENGESVRL